MDRLEELQRRQEQDYEAIRKLTRENRLLRDRIEHLQRENERLKVVLEGEREGMPVLIERTETLRRENERIKAVMEYLPSHEAFTTSNVLELYRAWESAGIVDQVIDKLHERNSQSDTLT